MIGTWFVADWLETTETDLLAATAVATTTGGVNATGQLFQRRQLQQQQQQQCSLRML